MAPDALRFVFSCPDTETAAARGTAPDALKFVFKGEPAAQLRSCSATPNEAIAPTTAASLWGAPAPIPPGVECADLLALVGSIATDPMGCSLWFPTDCCYHLNIGGRTQALNTGHGPGVLDTLAGLFHWVSRPPHSNIGDLLLCEVDQRKSRPNCPDEGDALSGRPLS
jgi:hypothetical protein